MGRELGSIIFLYGSFVYIYDATSSLRYVAGRGGIRGLGPDFFGAPEPHNERWLLAAQK